MKQTTEVRMEFSLLWILSCDWLVTDPKTHFKEFIKIILVINIFTFTNTDVYIYEFLFITLFELLSFADVQDDANKHVTKSCEPLRHLK
jgi:hypothetical protein